MQSFSKILKYIISFIGIMLFLAFVSAIVRKYFGVRGDNFFYLVPGLVLLLFVCVPIFRIKRASKVLKIVVGAASLLIFFAAVSSTISNDTAISHGFRNSSDYDLAQRGGFKDAATFGKGYAAGFLTLAEMNAAQKAGFGDKASYDKFLSDQAEADKARRENLANEKALPSSNPVKSDEDTYTYNWEKHEIKDAMTDAREKSYTLVSNDNRSVVIGVSCSKQGNIGLFLTFPETSGFPAGTYPEVVNVRIDNEKPQREDWALLLALGSAFPQNQEQFLNKLKGHEKLSTEIFMIGQNTFDIRGYDAVLRDMRSFRCTPE